EADDGFRWRRCLHRISYGVEAALRRPLAPSKPKPLLSSCDYGCTTALPARVTCVCANSRPFTDAPVPSVICVFPSTMPSMCEVVPRLTMPATCQTMFCGSAPPLSTTRFAEAIDRPPAIWKIQVSLALPESVTLTGIVTLFDHL